MLAPSRTRAVLGIERSALGRTWRDRLDIAGQAQALAIVQRHGHSDLLARVLAGRGVTAEAAPLHLAPSLRQLMPDPSALRDMDAAVDRLVRAIERGETIAVFGDYDVDGAASAALLAEFLTACGTPFRLYIPDRLFEGYGPNVPALRVLSGAGATLLVTVDCGTTSHAELGEARALGLDAIVIDHHQAADVLPPAIVVNPNRLDDLSGLGQLCAAGVVFMTLVALTRRLREAGFFTPSRPAPDLLAGLDLVALATVADVAPLTGLNRAFVTKGLAVMRTRRRPGLAALFDVAGADGPPRPDHLGFLVGPRINAGGRIGNAALGATLLGLTDAAEARRIAEELDRLNRERQAIEAAVVAEAVARAEAEATPGTALVVSGEGWHPGIVGLVAARLRERFNRPAFAISFDGEVGTGSGRSVLGIDLGRAVRAAVGAGHLRKGGGHAMAAGITLQRARLGDFRRFLDETLATTDTDPEVATALAIDATLTAAGATAAVVESLEQAGPYGAGNPEPIFVLPAHRLLEVTPVGKDHLRARVAAGDGAKLEVMAFRAAADPLGAALLAARGRAVHLAGSLSLDRWGGRERVRLRLIDLADAQSDMRVS